MAEADLITRITVQNQQFQSEIAECKKEINALKKSASETSTQLSGVRSGMKGVAAVAASVVGSKIVQTMWSFGKACVSAYADMEQLQHSFATMLRSSAEASVMLQRIKEYAKDTPYNTEGLSDAAKTMLQYGMNAEEIMPTLKQLGDIAVGDTNNLKSLSLAFAQMSAAGRVTKQDLNQMINAGFNPLQEISRKTGESMGVLLDKVSKGAISVNQIKEAFASATQEGGQFFGMMDGMNNTTNAKIAALADTFTTLKERIGEIVAGPLKLFLDDINKLVELSGLGPSKTETDYGKKTEEAVVYAKNKAKKGKTADERNRNYKETLQRGIDNEQLNLEKYNADAKEAAKALQTIKNQSLQTIKNQPWGKKSLQTIKNQSRNVKAYKGRGESYWKEQFDSAVHNATQVQQRINKYKSAMARGYLEPITTPTTPTTTTTTTTKEEVIPKGSLAYLQKQLQEAQKKARNAVGEEAYREAMKTVNAIQKQIDGWGIQSATRDLSVEKAIGSSKGFQAEGFTTESFTGYLPYGVGEKIQESIDKINLDAKIQEFERLREAMEALGSVNIESMNSIYNALTSISDITDKTARGFTASGAACSALGQALQMLGSQGAAAKAGLIMSALGQIAVSFANALNSAGKQHWAVWLAFAISGAATMMSLVSQLKGFSQGGILEGGNTHGDQMLARVNAGEMILNGSQQAKLFNLLSSNGAIGGQTNGKVDFVISGSNLKGVLRNYDKKTSIL